MSDGIDTTPTWERAKAAIGRGDADDAIALIDRMVAQSRSLQTYSINWITSLLSFVADELGEEAVERALRRSGDEFVSERRHPDWDGLPAVTRARAIVNAMVANFGTCEVSEDDEKITLAFRCGSGGRLIDEGMYDDQGGPFRTLREQAPRTFERDALPVYCAHCSVNNELIPLERGAMPTSIEHPPTVPGEPCVHHIYKDATALPDEVYLRLGRTPPPRT